MLHELAHTITERVYDGDRVAWHGWQFCEVYLKRQGLAYPARFLHTRGAACMKQHGYRLKKSSL